MTNKTVLVTMVCILKELARKIMFTFVAAVQNCTAVTFMFVMMVMRNDPVHENYHPCNCHWHNAEFYSFSQFWVQLSDKYRLKFIKFIKSEDRKG